MLLVYRIETKGKHRGPWCGAFGPEPLDYRDSSSSDYYTPGSMPTVYLDQLVHQHNQDTLTSDTGRFAYPSIATLRRWWNPSHLLGAHKKGFVLGLYCARAFKRFREQVVFDGPSATRLREVPLTRVIGVPFVRATRTLSHAIL